MYTVLLVVLFPVIKLYQNQVHEIDFICEKIGHLQVRLKKLINLYVFCEISII